MIRSTAAVVVWLCLNPAWLQAQTTQFTVNVPSAGIYQTPNTGSPIVGQTAKGAVLEVRRNLGNWIEVTWPIGTEGVAYVSPSAGLIGQPAPRPMTIAEYVARPASAPSPFAPPAASPVPASAGVAAPRTTAAQSGVMYVAPTHFVGLGGRIGGNPRAVGGTGRVWSRRRIGLQLEVSRDARTNAATADRMTTLQFAPSVLYSLPNQVNDYVWIRPYVGGGTTFYRSSLNASTSGAAPETNDTGLGLQAFGGGEITLAAVPRFAVSADVGYRKAPAPFAGFERRKVSLTVSGHWYVR